MFQLPTTVPRRRVDGPKSVLVRCQIDVVELAGVEVVVAVVLDVGKGDMSGDGFPGQIIADDLS